MSRSLQRPPSGREQSKSLQGRTSMREQSRPGTAKSRPSTAEQSRPSTADAHQKDVLDNWMKNKALKSDVSDEVAFNLLQEAFNTHPAFRRFFFKTNELKMLAKVLSIVVLEPEKKVMCKGEKASFCAILLSGFLTVKLPALDIALASPAIIGEMSFFEGGIRNADVVSGDKCRLAVISFDDITELASYYPNIIDRFVRALGAEGIKKLRKMMGKPAAEDEESLSKRIEDAPAETLLVEKMGMDAIKAQKARSTSKSKGWGGNYLVRHLEQMLKRAEDELKNRAVSLSDISNRYTTLQEKNLQLKKQEKTTATQLNSLMTKNKALNEELESIRFNTQKKEDVEKLLEKNRRLFDAEQERTIRELSHKANSLEKKLSIEKSSVEEKVQERTTELTAQIEQLKAENQLLASQGNTYRYDLSKMKIRFQQLTDEHELQMQQLTDKYNETKRKAESQREQIIRHDANILDVENRLHRTEKKHISTAAKHMTMYQNLQKYKVMLKWFAASQFMQNCLIRKASLSISKMMHGLSLKLIQEQQRQLEPFSDAKDLDRQLNQLDRKFSRKLATLANRRGLHCLRSLEAEAVDLSELLLSVIKSSEDHRLTAAGMCRRNIQLASELEAANKSVSEANSRMAQLRHEKNFKEAENNRLRNKNEGQQEQNNKLERRVAEEYRQRGVTANRISDLSVEWEGYVGRKRLEVVRQKRLKEEEKSSASPAKTGPLPGVPSESKRGQMILLAPVRPKTANAAPYDARVAGNHVRKKSKKKSSKDPKKHNLRAKQRPKYNVFGSSRSLSSGGSGRAHRRASNPIMSLFPSHLKAAMAKSSSPPS